MIAQPPTMNGSAVNGGPARGPMMPPRPGMIPHPQQQVGPAKPFPPAGPHGPQFPPSGPMGPTAAPMPRGPALPPQGNLGPQPGMTSQQGIPPHGVPPQPGAIPTQPGMIPHPQQQVGPAKPFPPAGPQVAQLPLSGSMGPTAASMPRGPPQPLQGNRGPQLGMPSQGIPPHSTPSQQGMPPHGMPPQPGMISHPQQQVGPAKPFPSAGPQGLPFPPSGPMGPTAASMPRGPALPLQGNQGPQPGMPSQHAMPSHGMPPQPGMTSHGMPPQPGMTPHGMPPQPGMTPHGMQHQPGMNPHGMPLQPGMPPLGMPPQPGMPPLGMPPQPGFPAHGMPPQPGMMPPMQRAPGMMMQQPQPQRKTLDPDQMPSPIQVIDDDQRANSAVFETREKGLLPPLVTTRFVVRDCGNVSPRFLRSTMYHVPATPDLLKQTGVPFALVVQPMAAVDSAQGEHEPPLTDFGLSTGPVRCVRCKAYMCPFMQFIDGGRRFQCVFCKATTDVPQEYFQHLDHTGFRLDHFQRPELCLGAYEVAATTDYCRDSKEPTVPGIIFAIDVSYPMIKEGVVALVCANMKKILKGLPVDPYCDKAKMRVGFITYDSKVHFYSLHHGLTQPLQMTVGDVADMFVPMAEGLLVDVDEAEAVIDTLMEQIPILFADTRETETVLGPVIQAGKEAFKAANCAGKLIVFHHNLPVSEAPGKLKNRDDRKVLGSDKERTVLTPQTKFYAELGQECVSVGCSVDLFLFNNAYIDVATLSQVCRVTGGQMYKYTYFQSDNDGDRFLTELQHNVGRPVVFDAIMRVRTSTGVRPVDFYGSFHMANATDVEMAAVTSDSTVACEIKHDDKLTEEDGVYIQVALLFTSCSGQRRLRVLNLALATGPAMAEMYRTCELDAIINFTAKQSINRLMESSPKAVRDHLVSNCAQILACYRKNCASPSSSGQLILPECMKLLPLYTNCLIKSDAIAGGPDLGCDERAFLMAAVSGMDVASTAEFFYPRLLPIHDLSIDESGLPPACAMIRCSAEKLRDDGIYVMDNGMYLFMYIGLAADPKWIYEVFGVHNASQIDVERTHLEERDNPTSRRVREVVGLLLSGLGLGHHGHRGPELLGRSRRPRLVLIRQREKLDVVFRHHLCEDRTGAGTGEASFSYVDFLCHMHKEIRALLG